MSASLGIAAAGEVISAGRILLVLCGIAAAIAVASAVYDLWSSPIRVFLAAIVSGAPIVLLRLVYGPSTKRLDENPLERLIVFVVVGALCAVASALAYELILK